MAFAQLALNRARLSARFYFALHPRYSILHAATVHFQLGFTRTARSNSTSLSRQVMPHPGQSRQQILQLRELDLQSAFTAPRALRENIENQLGAIENFARQQIFQIASLR